MENLEENIKVKSEMYSTSTWRKRRCEDIGRKTLSRRRENRKKNLICSFIKKENCNPGRVDYDRFINIINLSNVLTLIIMNKN